MASEEALEKRDVFVILDRLERNHAGVALSLERVVVVQHECDATTHPGCEVTPGLSEHDHHTAGHVLAAVVADPFDDCDCPAVPNREPLACHSVQVGFATRRAVE